MDVAEFDKFADQYRALHAANIRMSGESPEYFQHYKIREVAEVVGTSHVEGCKILDFGAGVGNSVSYFQSEFVSPCLVGVDVSHRSLMIARQRFPGQADFVRFDGEHLPFSDNVFEIAFVGCVLHHVPHSKHPGILHELRRVLRPTGFLFVFEHNPINPLTVRAVRTCPFDINARLVAGRVMRQRLWEAGLVDVVLRYRVFFPRLLRSLRPLERYLSRISLGAQYYVLGRKA